VLFDSKSYKGFEHSKLEQLYFPKPFGCDHDLKLET